MKQKIVINLIMMVVLVNIALAEKYFVLDVNQILGSVTFNSISLRDIDSLIKNNDNSGFLVKTVSFDNADIKTIYFQMPENRNYFIYVPYNEKAARIEVYNQKNSKVMDIDVSSYANTCGNKICEHHESYESCTKDCPSGGKDDFCDSQQDEVCDPDCSAKTDDDCSPIEDNKSTKTLSDPDKNLNLQENERKTKGKNGISYLFWALAVLSIIVILFLFTKKIKENSIINSLKQYINENLTKGYTMQQIKDTLVRSGYSQKEIEKAFKSA